MGAQKGIKRMKGMKQEIIVLSADAYNVDGASGVTVFYITDDLLKPVVNSNTSSGEKPGKANLPFEFFQKVRIAPAKYEAEFVMKANSQGKMGLEIKDLQYLGEVRLTEEKAK